VTDGAFDPNDYRKRVLAPVEKRGGPDASDPFELYDVPLERELAGELDDAWVAARVADVWGAWQRQRDHPKYRVLVGLLVESHAERSAELLTGSSRRAAAQRVQAEREQREAGRYELLDVAVRRLVERHGGIPRDKVAGLDDVGALSGLTPAEVAARLRRHRVVDVEAKAATLDPERRRQVRALLDEFGRLTDVPAPPTLLALLSLNPDVGGDELAATAAAWRARARELPPDRVRAVVDELLVHVAELLEPGRTAVEAYLDAVAEDVRAHLRPRVRAAVLVEDRLVADDHGHLVGEAVARGLDARRAAEVVLGLAAELGAEVEPLSAPAPAKERAGRAWEALLKQARAELRAGRPLAARRLVGEARTAAGDDGVTAVRAVADEIEVVLAEAQMRLSAAVAAADARRWAEALDHLDHLRRTASDVDGDGPVGLDELRERARSEVEQADRAVAAAEAGPEPARAAALMAVLAACPEHPGALAALGRLPLAAPAWVSATRDARGDVLVLWAPSDTPDVTYRVSRQRPDGGWQVVGRVATTSIEDGGAPPGVEAPVYAVSALQPGRSSTGTRSDDAPVPAVPFSAVPQSGPTSVQVSRVARGTVLITWDGVAGGGEYRVRCRVDSTRWRVVGRTRGTSIEDGGAPDGPLPTYGVSVVVGGTRSAETTS
jgi:hypothetical protein